MKRLLMLAVLTLAACAPEDPQTIDQCMRREIFKGCLAALPKGPDHTVTNDWAEVVDECQSVAYYQSLRRQSQVQPECRP